MRGRNSMKIVNPETANVKTVDPETVSSKTVDPEAASVKTVDPETASSKTVDPEAASVKTVGLQTESFKGIQRKIESWSTQFFLQVGEIYQSASSRVKSHLFTEENRKFSVGDYTEVETSVGNYTQLVTSDFKRPQVGERRSEKLFNERGDVPGWVLVVLMTTGLVTAIWTIAAPRLSTILKNSLDAMNGIR
jgi:hypothetical protein